ncbi:tetratricopeptide repeat protein [Rhodopirellula sp. MGV]|uniref:tetratricopeptide repeat protein n=1 Tax=Rhodopirellula sp. MGV TaxID=2023130 RepID=UPI001E4C4D6D|nr:tetratricopeptide repeat protein [Rhodopirellula sp. MGV]
MSGRTKRRTQLATALTLSMAIGCTGISGCTSGSGGRVASLNPFAKSTSTTTEESGWMNGPKNVATSIAGGAKTAATKSKDTVAGWFGKSSSSSSDVVAGDATDPTSLAHKAEVSSEVFVANGRLWESANNYEKAMESYGKALEKNPNDSAALAHIARLHFRQNNYQKAAEYFGKAIKENPEDAGLYNDLGLTLSKLGNHSAAASTIEQALKLSPGSSRYANNLASVKFESGDAEGAFQVLAANNTAAVAHFNMAYLHHKRGQASEATRHLNQSLAYEPQAQGDPATKRAVERSKQLLAQLQATPGAVTPNNIAAATITDKPTAAPTTAVQTVSTGGVPGTVGAASYRMPSAQPTATLPPATAPAAPSYATPSAATPSAATPSAATAPAATAPAATAPATAASAVKPPAGPSPTSTAPAAAPETSFSLPPGFQFPE